MNKRRQDKRMQDIKRGSIVELIEDTGFYKKGKRAHFIGMADNPNHAEIVWFGEESSFNEFGDVEEIPIRMLKKVDGRKYNR